eukprot:3420034-Rhodomonas_salina.1
MAVQERRLEQQRALVAESDGYPPSSILLCIALRHIRQRTRYAMVGAETADAGSAGGGGGSWQRCKKNSVRLTRPLSPLSLIHISEPTRPRLI